MMGVMQMGDGELAHDARRRQFWRTLGLIGLVGMPVGFGIGFVAGFENTDLGVFWRRIPDGAAIVIVALSVLAIGYGSWRFMKTIDEVELADNLWGSTAAYYIYALLFPAWWALAEAGVTSSPNHWLIFLAALLGGGAVYLARKWRAR